MTITTMPARLRKTARLNEDLEHLAHHRAHLRNDLSRTLGGLAVQPSGIPPLKLDAPVRVVLGGPWKMRELPKVLSTWGLPGAIDGFEALDLLVHLSNGGYGILELPSMAKVYAYAAKAAKHSEAAAYLELLAAIALRSQLTLSEAASLIRELADMDWRRDRVPKEWAAGWAVRALRLVDTWQARTASGERIGDAIRLAEILHELRYDVADAQIRQLEIDIAKRREHLAASRGEQ